MATDQQQNLNKTRFDGDDLRAMFSSVVTLFERNVDMLNALNVFPVPDGDTGTNMFLTLREVSKRAADVPEHSASAVAFGMARAALMEARGNSGVILSQLFKGFATEFEGLDYFSTKEFASALRAATVHAYKAVANPVEGTMLTVIRYMADAARTSVSQDRAFHELIDDIRKAASEAVSKTPAMLPVLKEAGLVDAGGHGLSVMLEGFHLYLTSSTSEPYVLTPPEPIELDDLEGTELIDFLVATDDELYGYCTQIWIEGEGLDPDAVRESLEAMARSTVVVGDDTVINLHVHADDPGPIVSLGVSLGTLTQVKIESMDEQYQQYAKDRRQAAGLQTSGGPTRPVAVVAVAIGKGLEDLFSELGATEILYGGDTMNPSISEILDAVEKVSAAEVILLPNNRNIISTAQQAAELSGKSIAVIASRSIPEGIAAILEYHPEKSLAELSAEMNEKVSSVRTGEVCTAVRTTTLNGVAVQEGEIIGLLDHKLSVSGENPVDVLVSLLAKADVAEGDLITLYWGEPLTVEDAELALSRTESAFPDADIELVFGGQPYYHFIVSIE